METRAYALKRYLFRLGHAQGSGRYATSIAQRVAGVAPVGASLRGASCVGALSVDFERLAEIGAVSE